LQTRVASTTQAASKKIAAGLKKAGKGIFKVKTLSSSLAAITGKNKLNYPDTFKAVWASASPPSLAGSRIRSNVSRIRG
jgi:hypothetical protein